VLRRLRPPFLDLGDSVVVITGASSGIGRATAQHLAGRGARLVLAARGRDALDDTVAECRDAGAEAIGVPTDVSDPDAVEALAEAALARFGRIDAWVNNAGVMAYGRFSEAPMRAHRQVIETNLLGALYGAHQALRCFRDQDRGVLVNVASLYAEMTTPFVSSYVTSKFGLLGFSRVVQRDLRPHDGVAVCCVLPASIDTPIFRHAGNYLGRRVRAIPPVADPYRVAAAIVGCLEHPRKEVRIGYAGRLIALSEKLLPPAYDRTANRAMSLVGFTGEEPEKDGNVFEASTDWQQVDGQWRNTTGRAATAGAVAASAGLVGVVVTARRRR
jgi:short-subunit dehydrogenase